MSAWKKYARIILPHVGLILISCVYIVGGATVFYFVESPNEVRTRQQSLGRIQLQRTEMLRNIWRTARAENASEGGSAPREPATVPSQRRSSTCPACTSTRAPGCCSRPSTRTSSPASTCATRVRWRTAGP